MRLWALLAAAFVAVGLYAGITDDTRVFPLAWSGVLLAALVSLRSDSEKAGVLGAGLLSAFLYATGTHDHVYTFGAAGVVCILTAVWIRSEDQDTVWNLGVARISVRPRVARAIRFAFGIGLVVAAIAKAGPGR